MSVVELAAPASTVHGGSRLPSVEVDSYNIESKDGDGFIGDKVNKSAFWDILERQRKAMRKQGDDPLGDADNDALSKQQLDEILAKGDPAAAGVVHAAIEGFAQEFAGVIQRYLKLKAWKDTERIVVGGGFRASRIGELLIGRTEVLLKEGKLAVEIVPIRNDPDDAGVIGAAHLAPAWMFKGHDAILGVDIGGTNIRVGVVELNLKKAPDLSKACVWKSELWRHADEDKLSRDAAIKRMVKMLEKLIDRSAKEGHKLAPFIGIGCPGKIESDGSIDRGAQNLPGNWESEKFNLPGELCAAIPKIGDHETMTVMHNDAVVQGLSEVPFMQDVKSWGVLTIGTGLGNAHFVNRAGK